MTRKFIRPREQIITLYCKCGFVYARKVNDYIYNVGRIKTFGGLWEQKLEALILSESLSLRKMALTMRCDPKTVVRYAQKLGLSYLLNSQMKLNNQNRKKTPFNEIDSGKYKQDITALIKDSPGISKTEIRKGFEKNMP